MQRYTVAQFNEDFPTEDACLEHVVAIVYPEWDGEGSIRCRKCEAITKHHRISTRKAYACDRCGTHVYPLAGTIFEKTTTPLRSWFFAMHMLSSTRTGVSAKQLERQLGVTYKTAWRMATAIRKLLDEDSGTLKGTVEIDETFMGGKPRYRQPRKGARSKDDPTAKIPVVGMVERGGNVKAWVAPDVKWQTIRTLAEAHIMPASMVFTDDARQYSGGVRRSGYQHRRVNHSARVYVDGDVHTNTIEGFWGLLKNSIRGANHAVGAAYLQSYVNEYTFRYNHRKDEAPMFSSFLGRVKKVRSGSRGSYAPVG